MGFRAAAVSLALGAAGVGCTAVQPGCPREWIEMRAGVFDLGRAAGPVDDAFGWSLGGGYDLNADALRLSWEVAAAWSEHDVGVPPLVEDEVDLRVLRLSSGLRLSTRLREAPLGAYVHGGAAWRNEASNDDQAFAGNDQWGTYAGAGLEWWFSDAGSLGPAVLYFRGHDDDLEETWFGLVARFY
jgi:hypothetical protein